MQRGDESVRDVALTGRNRIQTRDGTGVAGIGRVFVGHTVQWDGPKRLGNVYAIDSGAVFRELGADRGSLTMANMACRTEAIGPVVDKMLVDFVATHPDAGSGLFGAYAKPVLSKAKQSVFVFGSNLAGRHGKGAALDARKHHGAVYGVGAGHTGNAYAIPTKTGKLVILPLDRIQIHVDEFLRYAREHPELQFVVTKIGCGLAGYREGEISPMFAAAPLNCHLPDGWKTVSHNNQIGKKLNA